MLKKLVFSASLLAMAFAAPVEAKTHALLVGVADYDAANGIKDLLGPRNDVSIVWRLLKSKGADAADITVLTDGLPQDVPEYPKMNGAPKFAEIIAALDALAAKAEAGDTVMFYYSGHGTTQPDDDPAAENEPEPDGNDQVLLPADVGPYDPIKQSLTNALVDDILAQKFKAIRDKGAFVWVVIDACHSGTVTRGDDVTRSVDPASLGIPESATRSVSTRGGTRGGAFTSDEGPGGIVGFYAVDAQDEAIERPFTGYNLPMTGEGKKQRMGVFTYHLHRMVTQGGAFTYRDLAQQMVADLQTDKSGGRVPPPVFDGDLDKPILGNGLTSGGPVVLGSLKAKTLEIPAGTLHGFEVGARIALYDPKDNKVEIGTAVIEEATAISSIAGKVEWAKDAEPPAALAVPVAVKEPAVSFSFTISPPPAGEMTDAAKAAIEAAFGPSSGSSDLGITLGEPGNPDADVMLHVANGRIWIGRPERPIVTEAGRFDETPSLPLDGDQAALAEGLKETVWILAKAQRLIRVTSSVSGNDGGEEPDIEISAQLYRNPDKAKDPKAVCEAKANRKLPKQEIAPMMPVAAANCDFIEIKITNNSETTYYIGGFYVDARGKIDAIKQDDKANGCQRTLYPGGDKPVTYRLMIQTWDQEKNAPAATGIENTVILAIPQDSTKIAPRLCSLVQPSITALQATRSAETGTRGSKKALNKLLEGIGGSSTRSASLDIEDEEEEAGPKMAGKLFVFDVRP